MKRFSTVLISLFLSGCQVTQLFNDPGSMTDRVSNTHRDTVEQLSDKLDKWLTSSGQAQFHHDVMQLLNSDNSMHSKGVDTATGSHWKLESEPLQWQALELKRPGSEQLNFSEPVQFIGLPYYLSQKSRVYSRPSIDSEPLEEIAQQEIVTVLAKDSSEAWLLVERDSQVLGFIKAATAKPSITKQSILTARPLALKADTDNDLTRNDTILPMHSILGFYTCKKLKLMLKNDKNHRERDFTLCKKSNDIWFIDPLAEDK